ncbi:MAG: adenylate/guanylate cyclase domain-containing protein [Patescibacteria group bacterium]
MKTSVRRQLFVALFGLVCVLTLGLLDSANYFAVADSRLTDRLIVSHPETTGIVIVAIDNKSIQEFGVWPWPRSIHAQLIDFLRQTAARNVGYDVTFSETSAPDEDVKLAQAIKAAKKIILASEPGLNPLPLFEPEGTGLTTLITDPDGVVRSAIIKGSLTESVAEWIPASGVPTRIPYIGPAGSFQQVSFADVVSGKVPAAFFKQKFVLVGATAPDLHDIVLTPKGLMPGVEVQANILNAFSEGRSLRTPSLHERALLLLALALIVVLASIILRLRYLAVFILALLIAYLLLVVGLATTDLLLPILAPTLLITLIGGVDLASRYLAEQNQRRFIHAAFAHYLAPAVIEKLVKGETKLELGGVKRELTILFSDIRGFTSLSEKMKPEELVPFLNEYLTAMTDIVLSSEGVVDKYIGDAIMAFWGAPITQEDHAVRAAMTAVKMKRKLVELQEGWSKSGKPRIDIGVGLNTGEVLVGNMGSKQRFDYTVIGDDVNLASRLEGLTKQYGATILISESTRKKLGEAFVVRELDLVAVKGRTKPVCVYELVEESAQVDQLAKNDIENFEIALSLYREQRWDESAGIFESLAKTDKPSAVFLERTKYLKAHPPGDSWDGSYTAKEK